MSSQSIRNGQSQPHRTIGPFPSCRSSPRQWKQLLTLCMLTPFSPIHWLFSALTLLVEYALTAPNEIYSHFTPPRWIFIVLGSLERSGPSESILAALSSIDTSGPLPRPLQTTPPCLGTAQLNFTFLFGFLEKFNRCSQFKLRCRAEI